MPDLKNNPKVIIVAQGEHGGGELGKDLGEGRTSEVSAGHGDTHAAQGHGGEHGGSPLTHHPAIQFSISGLIVAVVLVILAIVATRKLTKVPGSKLQALAEITVEGLTNFARTSIGPGGEKFAPLIGSLFLFILLSNLVGALPLTFKAESGGGVGTYLVGPMANISMTFALAIIVFFVVQYTAIKHQGLGGRLKHLAGPVPAFAPLIFVIELIGEFVRPLSLSVRLFGNIFGEEMIVAVLIGLIASLGFVGAVLPLHLPIVLFGLLTAVVQAGVFCLLSCVYLQLAMEHHEEGHGEHGHDGHAEAAHAH